MLTGRQLFEAAKAEGLADEPFRGWEPHEGKEHDAMGEWQVMVPAIPKETKAKWERLAARLNKLGRRDHSA